MTFAFECKSCGAQLTLGVDLYERKVRGRVVVIQCKRCDEPIRIDDTTSAGGARPTSPASEPDGSTPLPSESTLPSASEGPLDAPVEAHVAPERPREAPAPPEVSSAAPAEAPEAPSSTPARVEPAAEPPPALESERPPLAAPADARPSVPEPAADSRAATALASRNPPSALQASRKRRGAWLPLALLAGVLGLWFLRGGERQQAHQRGARDAPRETSPVAPAPIESGAREAPPLPSAEVQPAPIESGAREAPPPPSPSSPAGSFDRLKAFWALDLAAKRATRCRRKDAPLGSAKVFVRFEGSGKVRAARVAEPPFAGTTTAECIEREMRSVSVAPFEGDDVTLGVRVTLF